MTEPTRPALTILGNMQKLVERTTAEMDALLRELEQAIIIEAVEHSIQQAYQNHRPADAKSKIFE